MMSAHSHDRHVFHIRGDLLPGTSELLPLSALADVDADAYRSAFAKYDDTPERRRLRDTLIPGLDRRWTDVVFLSPVHPHAIWSAWHDIIGKRLPPLAFWAIPARVLPAESVVLDRRRSAVGEPIDPAEVTAFDRHSFLTQTQTTAANLAWLRTMAERGVSGAWFHGVPHVLSPDPVSLSNADIVTWDSVIDS